MDSIYLIVAELELKERTALLLLLLIALEFRFDDSIFKSDPILPLSEADENIFMRLPSERYYRLSVSKEFVPGSCVRYAYEEV